MTGAALKTFRVKVPAAATGSAAVIRAKSGLGDAFEVDEEGGVATGEIAALMPAWVAATLNPLGSFVSSIGTAKRAAFEGVLSRIDVDIIRRKIMIGQAMKKPMCL